MVSLALVFALAASLLISGCAKKQEQRVVNVYNWGENIDESIFRTFEQQTGIKVNYTTYESNEQLYAVLKMGGTNYDVIIPSDYMISRLIEEDMLEKLDYKNIPNAANIDQRYRGLDFDPADEYSVPYTWGVVGIIYNTSMVDEEITSWGALFDPKYSGQILQFDNSRDAMATALFYLGYSVNTTNETELSEAYTLLEKQKPILQGYVMDQIYDKLEGGEAAIGPYYAGDAQLMMENNPDLAFVVPEEGSNWFVDAMCIPKGATNKENAELFINFMCDTDTALKNMGVTCYATPVKTAYEALDEETRNNEIIFPGDDILSRCQIYLNLPQATLSLYDQLWVKLKSEKHIYILRPQRDFSLRAFLTLMACHCRYLPLLPSQNSPRKQ
ncbi:MAG: spermidine/putrescine ABC transporter substrate-binding protein [Clostridiales bacterium]|nr:spermidine/putrescine ABC transporter substrate-binding protein [Clostridiales bacterium]